MSSTSGTSGITLWGANTVVAGTSGSILTYGGTSGYFTINNSLTTSSFIGFNNVIGYSNNILIGSNIDSDEDDVIIIGDTDHNYKKILIGGMDLKPMNRKWKIMNVLFRDMQDEIKDLKKEIEKIKKDNEER